MRRFVVAASFLVVWMEAPLTGADVLVLENGSRSEVGGFEVAERAVHIVTLNGKAYSIIRGAVDVEATLLANGMAPEETASPGWKRRPSQRKPPAKSPPPPKPPVVAPPPVREDAPPPVRAPRPARSDMEAAAKRYRFSIFLNGALATSPLEFSEARRFGMFKEEALIDSRYRDPTSRGLQIGGRILIKGPIGLNTSVEVFDSDRESAFEAFLPHPFFFEQFRGLSGGRSGLRHQERALHLGAVFSKTWADHFMVDFFGGPSIFSTRTEVLVDVLYSEVYPYDAVVPLDAEYGVFEDYPLGYHIGASVTYRIVGALGIDFGLSFSKGRVQLYPSEDGAVEFDAGGLRAGAGIRLLIH